MSVHPMGHGQQPLAAGWRHVRLGLMILSAAILAGSICLAAGTVLGSIYLPEQEWTDTVSAIGGAAYLLAIYGSFLACALSLLATFTASRSAAPPAVLLLIAALLFSCLSSVLVVGLLTQAGQLPPLLPSRPSAGIPPPTMPGFGAWPGEDDPKGEDRWTLDSQA